MSVRKLISVVSSEPTLLVMKIIPIRISRRAFINQVDASSGSLCLCQVIFEYQKILYYNMYMYIIIIYIYEYAYVFIYILLTWKVGSIHHLWFCLFALRITKREVNLAECQTLKRNNFSSSLQIYLQFSPWFIHGKIFE